MADWPEHRDELTRKALDHLNDKIHENSTGKLSDAALWLVTDTIITITQGLTNKDDWDVMYAVREELGKKLGKKVSSRK